MTSAPFADVGIAATIYVGAGRCAALATAASPWPPGRTKGGDGGTSACPINDDASG